ncbi:hypothetical protein KM043_008765 [Ampulex compressa]|nr:hypothetical protein KM043_008765 [Ampulex compressa]
MRAGGRQRGRGCLEIAGQGRGSPSAIDGPLRALRFLPFPLKTAFLRITRSSSPPLAESNVQSSDLLAISRARSPEQTPTRSRNVAMSAILRNKPRALRGIKGPVKNVRRIDDNVASVSGQGPGDISKRVARIALQASSSCLSAASEYNIHHGS